MFEVILLLLCSVKCELLTSCVFIFNYIAPCYRSPSYLAFTPGTGSHRTAEWISNPIIFNCFLIHHRLHSNLPMLVAYACEWCQITLIYRHLKISGRTFSWWIQSFKLRVVAWQDLTPSHTVLAPFVWCVRTVYRATVYLLAISLANYNGTAVFALKQPLVCLFQ